MPDAIVALGEAKIPVGRLRFENQGRRQSSAFIYDQSWLAHPDRFAPSPGLPLQEGPFYASGRDDTRAAIAGAFADAAPDSWGRGLMRRALGDGLTEFNFLVQSNDFTRQGALRFLGENEEPLSTLEPPVPRLARLDEVRAAAARFERDPGGTGEEVRYLAGIAGSLGGVRPKANVMGPDGLWIAKFTSEGDRRPVERVEVATIELAATCGLRVATAQLELAASDYPVALIKRFDRRGSTRIPYISARTALQHAARHGGYYTDIADIIRKISLDAAADLREIWRRLLFSILVRNTDDHLKNHGFLYAGAGRWRLAPAFDINPQPQRAPAMATGISPLSGFDPSIAAAIEVAVFFGLKETGAREDARAMGRIIAARWRPLLERHRVRGADLSYYADAFEHSELEAASKA